jgi:hypothetical protein
MGRHEEHAPGCIARRDRAPGPRHGGRADIPVERTAALGGLVGDGERRRRFADASRGLVESDLAEAAVGAGTVTLYRETLETVVSAGNSRRSFPSFGAIPRDGAIRLVM